MDMNNIPPEVLAQLMELGTMDEQGGDLDAQLAQAQALGQPGPEHTTPWGAALGGLGSIISGVQKGREAADIRAKKADLLKRKEAARKLYAQQMLGLQPPTMQGTQATQPQQASSPFGLGPAQGNTPYGAGPYGYNPGGGQ